jgi:hypothetical protein
LRWTLDPTRNHWRKLDWEIVQEVVNDLVQAYTKAMMTFKDFGERAYPDFENIFTFSEEAWDMLAVVASAKGWRDIPSHRRGHDCTLCKQLEKA